MEASSDSKPTRFRIVSLMELIVVLAVGAACARGYSDIVKARGLAPLIGGAGVVRAVGGAGLVGLAVAGGLGLGIEFLAGDGKRAWGPGRWVWAISGSVVVLSLVARVADILLGRSLPSSASPVHSGGPLSYEAIRDTLLGLIPGLLNDEFPIFLSAFCVLAFLRKELNDPAPDHREWSGRVFASLVVAQRVAIAALTT